MKNTEYVFLRDGTVHRQEKIHPTPDYAESCILTPSDVAFARDGVAADTAANTETIAFADLKLSDLRVARSEGTTRNLRDRRFDLYRVVWNRHKS